MYRVVKKLRVGEEFRPLDARIGECIEVELGGGKKIYLCKVRPGTLKVVEKPEEV